MYISNYISNSILHLYSTIEKKIEGKVVQLWPTLSNPMDCSLPGSSVLGIFQARVLEWVAISFSRGKIVGFTNWAKLDHIPTSDPTCLGLLPDYPEAVEEWRCFLDYSWPLSTLYSSPELRQGVAYRTRQTWYTQGGNPGSTTVWNQVLAWDWCWRLDFSQLSW